MSQPLSSDVSLSLPARRPKLLHAAIGLFLVALAIMLVIGAMLLPADKGYSIIGAQAFPLAVAGLLGIVGGGLAWQGLSGGLRFLPASAAQEAPIGSRRWTSAAWVAAGLIVNALLITKIGFVLSSTLLFMAAARGFGSTRMGRDAAIGLLLVTPVYLGFTKGLSVPLPALIPGWI